jgi:RHS repeat-associated protein
MNHGLLRFIAPLLFTLLSVNAQAVEEVIYYHNDALGSPIAATDQEGRVVWRKSYAPYGQSIGPAAPNEPGYTGKFEEPDLGIQDFGARWYDPRIGRFLAIDPAGFDPQDAQSFNRYAYANNNPYRYVDPDGRWAEDAVLGIPSLAIGAASLSENIANGNLGSAALDAVGIVGDSIAVGVPAVPGGIGLGIKAARAADKVNDATRVPNSERLLLGRSNSVATRVAEGRGKASTVDSTDPRTIYKQNARDMRSAKEIEFDAGGVPRSLDEILSDPLKQGQFSRAERSLIDNRPDIHAKTFILHD